MDCEDAVQTRDERLIFGVCTGQDIRMKMLRWPGFARSPVSAVDSLSRPRRNSLRTGRR